MNVHGSHNAVAGLLFRVLERIMLFFANWFEISVHKELTGLPVY
jgi:hypothetical protein